jgi:transglutaminase-like putative cysteine protease
MLLRPMLLRIVHTTRFEYEKPAYQSHNEVRMWPLDSPEQRCVKFELETKPSATALEYRDYYGNRVLALSVHPPHTDFTAVARSTVERIHVSRPAPTVIPFKNFLLDDRIRYQTEYDFLSASHHIPFSEPLRKFFWRARPRGDEDVTDYASRIVTYIHAQFAYEPGKTKVQSTADEILTVGAGVCQDFAHLTIGVLRLAGIPARYISGYLAPALDTTVESVGAQASHAWLEVQLPGAGWTGFDPTNGCQVDHRHIRVAIGRDYSDVPPMRGVYRSTGLTQSMTVELRVEPESAQTTSAGPESKQQNQQ